MSATTTTTVPTITRREDGAVILSDLPFMIPNASQVTPGAAGRANRIMGRQGLGWSFDQNAKVWVGTQPGDAAAAVARLADFRVAVVDLSSGKAAAPARKATRKPAAPKREASIMTNAEVVGYDRASMLASKITAALASENVDTEIIAAAVTAATAAADKIAKSATATVSTPGVPRKVNTRKAAAPATHFRLLRALNPR